MSCTPLPKAAKPVWAKQLTRLPCLVVYVKFQFVSKNTYLDFLVGQIRLASSRLKKEWKKIVMIKIWVFVVQ